MATVTMTIEEYEALIAMIRADSPVVARMMETTAKLEASEPKLQKKRKKSKYNKELGRQLKLLKKKHPRTPVTKLMKKAHRETKKALK